jgi:hypothetical protein
MIATLAPLLASSDANNNAEVVFPAPPFGFANEIVGIGAFPS